MSLHLIDAQAQALPQSALRLSTGVVHSQGCALLQTILLVALAQYHQAIVLVESLQTPSKDSLLPTISGVPHPLSVHLPGQEHQYAIPQHQ